MAKRVASVELQVLLKSVGIEATSAQVNKLKKELISMASAGAAGGAKMEAAAKKTEEAHKRVGEVYRNNRGVAQATGRAEKDFSRMQQGLGGLVQAYASVAANVYALSSAFLVLRRAADLSSMIKSAEDFSNRFGRSVTDITMKMQEASGGALSFADALPTINKAISAGLGTEKIEALTVAATKASQTFGGTANEALNRFISAAQRGRVEIIQTLGIVINTEKAYEQYAAQIGKAKDALTSFDKSQAIVNATIEESQNVFDGVNIDPNPFQQMLTTMVDLKDTISTFITDGLTPLVNFFNKSKDAALILLLAITKMIGSTIFPKMIENMKSSQKELQSMRMTAVALSAEASRRRVNHQLEENVKLKNLTEAQLKTRIKLFEDHYAKGLMQRKAYHAAILKEDGSFSAKQLNIRKADLLSEQSYRSRFPGRRGTGFGDVSDKALQNQINAVVLAGEKVEGVTTRLDRVQAATSATNNKFRKLTATMDDVGTSSVANAAKARAAWQKNFLTGMLITEGKVTEALKNLKIQFKTLAFTIRSSNLGIAASFVALKGVVAASAGILVGALSVAVPWLITIGIALSAGKFLWEKYGDSIRGITPAMREAIDAQEEFGEKLKESESRINKYTAKVAGEAIDSLREYGAALQFVSGSFLDLNERITNVVEASVGSLELGSVEDTINRINELQNSLGGSGGSIVIGEGGISSQELQSNLAELARLKKELKILKDIDFTELGTNFEKLFKLAEKAGLGFSVMKDQAVQTIETLTNEQGFSLASGQIQALANSLANSDIEGFSDKFKQFAEEAGVNSSEALFLSATAVQRFSGNLSSFTGTIDKNIKGLEELNKNTFTYFENYKRSVLTASGANKEFTNILYDIANTTQELINVGQGDNMVLADIIGDPDQLKQLKQLLGFSAKESVKISEINRAAVSIQQKLFDIAKRKKDLEAESKLIGIETARTQERIVTSDAMRVEKVKLLGKLKEEELKNSKELIRNQLQGLVAERNQAKAAGSVDRVAELNQRIEILRQQILLEDERFRNQEKLTPIQERQAELAVEQAEITSRINVLNSNLAEIKNRINLTGEQRLSSLRKENSLEVDVARQQVVKLKAQRAGLQETEQNTDELRRQTAELDAAIDAEEQRIKLIEYRNRLEEMNLAIRVAQAPINNARELYSLEVQRLELTRQFSTSWKQTLDINASVLALENARSMLEASNLQIRKQALLDLLESGQELTDEQYRELNVIEAKLRVIRAQNDAYEDQLEILRKTAGAQEAQRRLKIIQDINTANKTLADIQSKLVSNSIDYIALQEKSIKLSLEQIKYKKLDLLAQMKIIAESEKDPVIKGLRLTQLQAELDVLEAQSAEIKRQAETIYAMGLEKSSSIFSKDGLKATAHFFRRAMEDELPKLRSTFEILGRGFAKTVNDTFDTIITNLLEGGKDFAETVREGLKASLRDVFGSALKDRIKESFITLSKEINLFEKLFPEEAKDDSVEKAEADFRNQATEWQNKVLENWTTSLDLLRLIAGNTGTSGEDVLQEIPLQSPVPGMGKTNLPSSPIAQQPQTMLDIMGMGELASKDKSGQQIVDLLIKNNKISESPVDLGQTSVKDLNAAPNVLSGLGILGSVVSASQGESKVAIVQALFAIAAQIIASQQAAAATGMIGAMGGIAPGGFQPLATGGIVTMPTLGLIGEGDRNEAVVPLPNNREIPVEMRGGGETININTEQHFDFTNANADTISQLRVEAKMIEERTFNKVFSEINKGGRYAKMVGRR